MPASMINFYNGGGTLADVSEGCSWFVEHVRYSDQTGPSTDLLQQSQCW